MTSKFRQIFVLSIRGKRSVGNVANLGDRRGAYRVLVERPEDRRPVGKWKNSLEGNNKMDLSEVKKGVDCIDVDQDRDRWRAFVNLELNLPVP